MDHKKKNIILQHGGGELANQLWNFISIYAFSLKTKRTCQNYSFFEYNSFFNIPVDNYLIDLFFFKPFKNHLERRGNLLTKILRKIYKIYVSIIEFFYYNNVISSKNTKNEVIYLPPSPITGKTKSILEKAGDTIYFDGWLFRNPVGIEKYRKEILEYFKPNKKIEKKVDDFIYDLRKKYEHIVGVHIRQGDYKNFKGGKYFIEQKKIREIIDEYLIFTHKDISKTCFVITSDGKIDEKKFKNLNYIISDKNAVEDFFILSRTDVILGSDSSFGEFSAYYGNIPHIIFKKEKIDWEYYKEKKEYFQNEYCTMINY